MEPLLTPKEVAKILNVSQATAYRLLMENKIPRIKIGGCVRAKREDVETYIKNCTRRVYGDKANPRYHYTKGMKIG